MNPVVASFGRATIAQTSMQLGPVYLSRALHLGHRLRASTSCRRSTGSNPGYDDCLGWGVRACTS
jgi:hypothetical protein